MYTFFTCSVALDLGSWLGYIGAHVTTDHYIDRG